MSTTTKAAPKVAPKIIIADIQKGDVFSESSHYLYVGLDKTKGHQFTHLESGNPVFLSDIYVENLLNTADQYTGEPVMVGREDKFWTAKQVADWIADPTNSKADVADYPRVGDVRVKGIRTLFEEIHSTEVFGLCFQKQDKKLTKAELAKLRGAQEDAAIAMIGKAQKNSKSMKTAYAAALKMVQENPISEYAPGEMRELRGYKVQFNSRDGRYDCIDMDLPKNDNVRPVNINTLQWLVYRGVKYVVEK